jgi:2-dehydro-3-deoxyphosphogluconate aldolase/(4S)-4-hydroxy-2-oxoglutarate aldolase
MSDVLNEVNAGKMVAIIRAPSSELLVDVAKAIYEGGIRVIEVTMTVPNALEIIAEVHRQIGDKIILGAGSVIDSETARAAMLAGAEFIVSPVVRYDVIQCCKRYGKAVMPGAFTPTEILTAWEAGADVVKVFPANIGGPGYLKAVKAPLPQVQLMPTGGVNLETLESFMDAGACAVGLGSSLVTKELMAAGDVDGIRNLSVRYVELMERWKASKSK